MGQGLFGQSESRWFSTLSIFFPDNIGSSHLLSSFWGVISRFLLILMCALDRLVTLIVSEIHIILLCSVVNFLMSLVFSERASLTSPLPFPLAPRLGTFKRLVGDGYCIKLDDKVINVLDFYWLIMYVNLCL